MINVASLKAEIVRNGMTQQEFCKKIGMAQSTFVRKMKKGELKTTEAMEMIKLLKIKNPEEIFFANHLTSQVK